MKTKLLALTAVSAVLFSASALAQPQLGFSKLGDGNFLYADTWNYATDRGVDVNNDGAFNNFDVGDRHTFTTQMAINSFQDSNPGGLGTYTPTGLNATALEGGFELTKTISLDDYVTGVSVNTDPSSPGFNNTTVTFNGGATPSGTMNIYLDYYNNTTDASKSTTSSGVGQVSNYGAGSTSTAALDSNASPAGTGPNLGPILTAHMVSTDSSFTARPGGGLGTGSFQVLWQIDYVNATYLDVSQLGLTFLDSMDGTLTQPASNTPNEMWNGVASAGINGGGSTSPLFDVSGRQIFAPVPEPTSLALLGAGLLLSGYRKRKQA